MTLPGLDPLTAHVHRKAVSLLRTRLQKDERVVYAAAARWRKKEGILAATESRLLFALPGVWGGKVQHILFADLRRLAVDTTNGVSTIIAERAANSTTFTGLSGKAADEIATIIRKRTRRYPQKSAEQLKLEHMARMMEKGSMTQGEFDWNALGLLGPPGKGGKK